MLPKIGIIHATKKNYINSKSSDELALFSFFLRVLTLSACRWIMDNPDYPIQFRISMKTTEM